METVDNATTPAEETLLDGKNFLIRFGKEPAANKCVVSLHALISRLNRDTSFDERAEWLEDLTHWLFRRGSVPGRLPGEPTPTARLRLFLDVLDVMVEQKDSLRSCLAEVVAGLNYVRLFTDTGLPSETGFFAELWERGVKNVLPEPPIERDAATLLHRLFPSAKSSRWFDALAPELRHRLFMTLALPARKALAPAVQSMQDAAVLLAIRVADTGTADDVRERCPDNSLHSSPFLQLPVLVRTLIGADAGQRVSDAEPGVAVREGIGKCRKLLREVVSSLDTTGISISLVYRLEYIRHLLDRLYSLLTIIAPPAGTPVEGIGAHLVQGLIRGGVKDRSINELLRTNSRLIARRVIERAGRTGEHYITRSREEQHQMVSSAAGGGAITAFMVVLKFLTGWAHLPLLIESLSFSINYAGGFVLMQLLHFTLATKQPSMTAAALAHSIKETGETPDLGPLVDQVVRTVRSQLAAFAGNLGMVVPCVIIIDLVVWSVSRHHVLSPSDADHTIAKHHPFTSGTMLFAAITGIYLWASSVIAGTIENWFVVQKLPDAIRTNRRLRSVLGRQRASELGTWWADNIAALGGNISFGIILGLIPMLANMVGIPLEVRHITFVTGQLAFAGMQRGAEGVLHADFLWSLSSIGIVGFFNFSVSFALALFVAFRAREVQASDQVRLLFAVLKRFTQRPLDFIRAPSTDAQLAAMAMASTAAPVPADGASMPMPLPPPGEHRPASAN